MKMKSEEMNYKVCVRCFTFNQSKYITDTLNGFVMQQTDFPYVCCIVDDASKDGEQEVIRKYVADNFDLSEDSCHFERETDYAFITYAQHKTNKNCYFAVLYLKENHFSIKKPKMPYLAEWQDECEYHALCEGDDYWTNETKLQKQVDFLDSHLENSMCFYDVKTFNEDTSTDEGPQSSIWGSANSNMPKDKKELFYYIMEGKCRIQTLSVMYRSKLFPQIPKDEYTFMMGDTCLWLNLSQLGPIHYIPDCVGVYRVHEGSACHNKKTQLRFNLSMFEMRVYYCHKYRYEVSKYVKNNYNKALFKYYCSNSEFFEYPLYPAFHTSFFQDFILAKPKLCKVLGRIINCIFWFKFDKFKGL